MSVTRIFHVSFLILLLACQHVQAEPGEVFAARGPYIESEEYFQILAMRAHEEGFTMAATNGVFEFRYDWPLPVAFHPVPFRGPLIFDATAISEDGSLVASANESHVMLWSAGTEEPVVRDPPSEDLARHMFFSANGARLYWLGFPPVALSTKDLSVVWAGGCIPHNAAYSSKTDELVLVCHVPRTGTNRLVVLDGATGAVTWSAPILHAWYGLSISDDGSMIAVGKGGYLGTVGQSAVYKRPVPHPVYTGQDERLIVDADGQGFWAATYEEDSFSARHYSVDDPAQEEGVFEGLPSYGLVDRDRSGGLIAILSNATGPDLLTRVDREGNVLVEFELSGDLLGWGRPSSYIDHISETQSLVYDTQGFALFDWVDGNEPPRFAEGAAPEPYQDSPPPCRILLGDDEITLNASVWDPDGSVASVAWDFDDLAYRPSVEEGWRAPLRVSFGDVEGWNITVPFPDVPVEELSRAGVRVIDDRGGVAWRNCYVPEPEPGAVEAPAGTLVWVLVSLVLLSRRGRVRRATFRPRRVRGRLWRENLLP